MNQDRATEDGDREREETVWEVGVVQGIRQGPWAFPANNASPLGRNRVSKVLHWGTTCRGVYRCFLKDKEKTNAVLWKSLRTPIRHSTLFTNKMPRLAKLKLKDLANLTNKSTVAKTFIERFPTATVIDMGFDQEKDKHTWSIDATGRAWTKP